MKVHPCKRTAEVEEPLTGCATLPAPCPLLVADELKDGAGEAEKKLVATEPVTLHPPAAGRPSSPATSGGWARAQAREDGATGGTTAAERVTVKGRGGVPNAQGERMGVREDWS